MVNHLIENNWLSFTLDNRGWWRSNIPCSNHHRLGWRLKGTFCFLPWLVVSQAIGGPEAGSPIFRALLWLFYHQFYLLFLWRLVTWTSEWSRDMSDRDLGNIRRHPQQRHLYADGNWKDRTQRNGASNVALIARLDWGSVGYLRLTTWATKVSHLLEWTNTRFWVPSLLIRVEQLAQTCQIKAVHLFANKKIYVFTTVSFTSHHHSLRFPITIITIINSNHCINICQNWPL